ncbi:hypothetical protein ACQ859_25640 [Roseateles chitinivorans]|uniref:hypothetical protein n=1 Tax=Roseateles chitinivorans TaxID=2917965 RepID=UPI003D675C3F
MSLTSDALHPARRIYVLKLDRQADPALGMVSGRVENLATGRVFDFDDAASLMAGLARELDEAGDPATAPSAPGGAPAR